MSTEPLLLRVSDLPERWPTSPSLLWPVEVVVREGVLPGRDIVSREREAFPGVIFVSSQIYIIYRGVGRDQHIDQCCPGKLFSALKPKKEPVC